MINASKLTAVFGLFVAAFFATTFVGTGTAEAYACKTQHRYLVGAGVHSTQAGAISLAKSNWQAKAKDKFGLPWSVWNISEGKHVQCAANGGGGQSCVVRSRPCKYVTG